jgi:hypothetical protein
MPEDNAARGGTRWWRFALSTGIALAGLGVLLAGMSGGALAATFTISGTEYKISADQLRGTGVVQYGSVNTDNGTATPVFVNGFRTVSADNFCQSFVVRSAPFVGDFTMVIASPGRSGFTASNLVIASRQLGGDLSMTGVQLGGDAAKVVKGPPGATGYPGSFSIQADGLGLDHVRQVALSTTAATLNLNQVNITAQPGDHECF